MVSVYGINSPNTMVVVFKSVNSQRHEMVLRSYHLPLVPKTQWIVKNVIFKVVTNVELCYDSFQLACWKGED